MKPQKASRPLITRTGIKVARIYFGNLPTMLGISAIMALPFALLEVPFVLQSDQFAVITPALGRGIDVLGTAAFAIAVGQILAGPTPDVLSIFRGVFNHWKALLIVAIFLGLVSFIQTNLHLIPELEMPDTPSSTGLSVVGVLIYYLIFLATFFWIFAPQVIVLEGRGGIAGLIQSLIMVERNFWEVLNEGFILLLIILLPYLALGGLSQWLSSLLSPPTLATPFHSAFGLLLVTILISPFSGAYWTLVYYNLKNHGK